MGCWLGLRALKTLYLYLCKVIKKNWKDFCKEFCKKLWKKIILGASDTWSMRWSSHRPILKIVRFLDSVILVIDSIYMAWILKFIYQLFLAVYDWKAVWSCLSLHSKIHFSELLILLIISTKFAIPSQCELPSAALGSIMMCDV